jgi:hypothetical protein
MRIFKKAEEISAASTIQARLALPLNQLPQMSR